MRLKRFVLVTLLQGLWAASACDAESTPVGAPTSAAAVVDAPQWRSAALKLALENSRAIEDSYRRAEALASVARTQAVVDEPRATTRTIHEALTAARLVSEAAFRGWVLHDIVLAQTAADDLHGARETAKLIEADRPHGAAQAALAEIELRRGNLRAAQAIAGNIRDEESQGLVLRQIIALQTSGGEVEAARSLLRSIRDPFYESLARGDLAVAEVRAGRIERAHELAAGAPRKQRAEVYGRIALARVSADDLRGAFETAQKIRDVLVRSVVEARIAAQRAQAGEQEAAREQFASAIAATERTPSSPRKALTLGRLARLQAASGDPEAAHDTLRRARDEAMRLPPGEERDDAIDYIARSQARAGDMAGALDSARLSNDRIARALLVRDAITLRADATSASATASAAAFDDPLIRTAALFGVLGVQTLRKGESTSLDAIDAARRAVREIDDPQLKPAAFAALAAARIRMGGRAEADAIFNEALGAAAALERTDQRAAAYVRIVNALDERLVFLGQPAAAPQTAN